MFVRPVDPRILAAGDALRHQAWRSAAALASVAMGNRIREQLHPSAPIEPQAAPRILIPQRTAVGDQVPTSGAALGKALDVGGWNHRATYAMAERPTGELVESCVIWYVRGRWRGKATWLRVDGGGWSFADAWIGPWRYGWQRGKGDTRPTICEAVREGGY